MEGLFRFLFSSGRALSFKANEPHSPWSPLEADRRFGRLCRLHLQGSGVSPTKTSVK